MKNLLLRACLIALAFLSMPSAIAPATAQGLPTVRGPSCFSASGPISPCIGMFLADPLNGNPITPSAAPSTYTLLTAATPSPAATPPAGDYNVLFPPTLGGSTFSVAQLSNGSTTTRTWTAAQIAAMIYPPCIPVSAGDIISASVTGGTPTGNTVFAGATRCGPGDVSPAPVMIASTTPAAWATGSTAQDVRRYGSATIQVEGLSGGDTIAVTGSLSGNNYAALTGLGADFSTVTTISTDGIYSFSGGQFLKWAKTGSASTPTLTIRTGS